MKTRAEIVRNFSIPYAEGVCFDPKDDRFSELLQATLVETFKDFNFRTLTVNKPLRTKIEKEVLPGIRIKTGEKKNGQSKTRAATITEFLAKQIAESKFSAIVWKYFCGKDSRKFDDIHHSLCMEFLNAIKYDEEDVYYKNSNKDPIAYGKAQKIVNMMFKHFYCMKNAETYEAYFAPCHMPIDSFTLEWLKRQNDKVENNKLPEWSNLEYDRDKSDGKYTYLELVKFMNDAVKIRSDRFSDCSAYTPLQAEFFIWPEIQRIIALENLIYTFENGKALDKADQSKDNTKMSDLKAVSLKEKVERANDVISAYALANQFLR